METKIQAAIEEITDSFKKKNSLYWNQLQSAFRKKPNSFKFTQATWEPFALHCADFLRSISKERFYALYNELAEDNVFFDNYTDDELHEGKFDFVYDVLDDQGVDLMVDELKEMQKQDN